MLSLSNYSLQIINEISMKYNQFRAENRMPLQNEPKNNEIFRAFVPKGLIAHYVQIVYNEKESKHEFRRAKKMKLKRTIAMVLVAGMMLSSVPVFAEGDSIAAG
ncbi:MAG: hypothetical protein RR859_09095, partial [Ruthenibacterium sp.]